MGQKVNPISFRVGINHPWQSRWYAAGAEYKKLLNEDIKLRDSLFKKLALAGIQTVEIERLPHALTIRVKVSRPGVVIGRGGSGIEDIRKFVLERLGYKQNSKDGAKLPKIEIQVEEVKNPDLSARLVAQRIVSELERRMPQRRVVTKTMERVMASGAKGIKVALSTSK